MITDIIQTGTAFIATIDGVTRENITEASRFWSAVQDAIANGAAVRQLPEAAPDPKLVGVAFDGVMCSATGQDQNGLVAVHLSIQLQGAAFPATRFQFDNGNTLIITAQNHQDFMEIWLPFRQSFYLADVEAE
jgi:hypothetical protein